MCFEKNRKSWTIEVNLILKFRKNPSSDSYTNHMDLKVGKEFQKS